MRISMCLVSVLSLVVSGGIAEYTQAAELVQLAPDNWDAYAPTGKEADCIHGDYVLRNDKIIAVIAEAIASRHANMTIHDVGGSLIDLTLVDNPNDQLQVFYPAAGIALRFHSAGVLGGDNILKEVAETEPVHASGKQVALTFVADVAEGKPAVEVVYSLGDGDESLRVETKYSNPHDKSIKIAVTKNLRVWDANFVFGSDNDLHLYWAYESWWKQAYGFVKESSTLQTKDQPKQEIAEEQLSSSARVELAPGASAMLIRRVVPATDSLGVMAIAARLAGRELHEQTLIVDDPAGPVSHAVVKLTTDAGQPYARGRTNDQGVLQTKLPTGKFHWTIRALGREPLLGKIIVDHGGELAIHLPAPGYVVAKITDAAGQPIPCKVDFHGVDGTPDPDFGPNTAIHGVRNLYYTHDGTFQVEITPGKYEVLVSHGPEYDAERRTIEVQRGQNTAIDAKLLRSVETPGWLSAELHSHSSPSGDNSASQRGRVLNHLAEHIEFAPCTEHNRISTYVPHLEHFGAMHRIATCSGMELTGKLLPVNHQNAFPLIHKPRTQDGGGPVVDVNPEVQIERLVMWDNGSDKLVQTNHPNIVQMIGDRDLDGKSDGGFAKMLGFMDVIEVHMPDAIFMPASELKPAKQAGLQPIFHWLQLLNLGYRVPGVVNTDAHYNFHGTGWLRNYIQSPTDNPSQADIMDLCHAAERGTIIMTNGPYMEVQASTAPFGGKETAEVGGDIEATDGQVEIHVRVQCPNWLDVNRVQLFVNGRADEKHNYTRRTHAAMFHNDVVKFDQKLALHLKKDAHVIVATAGEGLTLGRVYGPDRGKSMPVAVANPIFVDIDGGGFQANGDLLGYPLPLEATETPVHGHLHHND